MEGKIINRRDEHEFSSSIDLVRGVEDSIRASKRYTKGNLSKPPEKMQGADFPSRTLTEYYEVYPDTEISWDMPWGTGLDWLWNDLLRVDVRFLYDYRSNKAKVVVAGNDGELKELKRSIPGFAQALERIVASNQ